MPRGRKKGTVTKVGGRKKGTPNKRTVVMRSVEELIRIHKIDPLDLMFRAMKTPLPKNNDFQQKMVVHDHRLKAANSAAPYTRPRLASTELTGRGAGGAILTVNENKNSVDPNDPAMLEAARRVAFVMAEGHRLVMLKEKVVNPPKDGT